MKYKILGLLGSILIALGLHAQNEVTVHINSGNPNFPFPQFLAYEDGTSHHLENLGTKNPEGVVHAEMEQDIRDAYQIFANEWTYTGDQLNGVKYIRGNLGCPYDCREGDGYSLLAAAIMGDKVSFDGLWMCVHDKARVKQPRYIDGVVFEPNYAYGDYALKDNANSATDGDVDIALALYIAWMQWGDDMGVRDSRGNMISYRKEMIDVIRGLVAMSTRFPTENPQRCNTGEIGFDGYMKNGDTWTEITGWASQAANYYVEDGIQKYPEYGGPQQMHTDYLATGYFREFHDLLEKLDLDYSPAWEREQYRRAEASGDWMVGNWVSQSGTNVFVGEVASVSNANVVTMSAGNQGGRFRSPWRTALNYVWHGNPTYSWNPTTHKVVDGGNTYELNAAKQFSGFMNNPQGWGSGAACTEYGGGPSVTYKGPSTLNWDLEPNGYFPKSAFTLNWVPACGTPSAVAAQDLELLGQLYRQCNIEWDVKTGGDGYLTSVPVYFHGFFRLLGMLIATGNHQAPSKMVPQPNMKIYRVVKDSVSCAYTGDLLTYHLDYRNYGSVDAKDVKIVENVPDDFIFVSATNGGVYNAATHTVTWNIGTVPGFQTGGLDVTKGRVSYDVKIGPEASGRYCTTAEITCSNGLGWTSNEYPNAVTPTMQRNCVDVIKRSLLIEKTADREQANPGSVVNYTINFENSSEAGWLDGGRPRVGVAFANTQDGSQMWLKFRLYNDAIEPYINYGNYRISYYLYDASMKKLSDAGGAGWGWYTAIYEGKRTASDQISVSHETVVEGSDDYGKWNQRMILRFAPLLVTSTGHISNYYGMGSRVHRGGAEPLRVAGYLYPSDWSSTNYTDDWSWNAGAKDADDGNYYPVTPSWQEIDPTTGKSIEKVVNTYNPSICETPKYTVPNILVEEYDGYTWRRILGTGPMAGRDAENVVIIDTLPKGLTFVAFQGSCPLASSGATWRNYKISDGRDVVEWSIPMLQIKQKGSIVYSATANFPSGAKCQSADEDIDNLAWIYADLNSPIADTATVTVTCAKVPEPVIPTTLSKTADMTTVSVDDNITYTLEYEQTHGYINDNAGANASDWSGGSVSGGTVTNGSGTTAMYNNSTSKNIYVEFDASLTEYASATFIFRGDQKITVKKDYGVLIVTYGSKTERIAESSTNIHFAIDLSGSILRLWNSADTAASAPFTVDNVPVKEGKFGFNSPEHGSHKYSNIHVHTDYAYNLKIVDDFPSELEFVSATDGGTFSSGKVVWTKEQGMDNPIPFGQKYTVSVTAKVKECSEKLINEAHVELLGHSDDEIRAQAVAECGASCPPKPTVTSPISFCQGEAASALSATGTALKWYTSATGGTGQTSITPSTTTAGTTTYYVSQTANDCESPRAAVDVIVNPKPTTPTITSGSPYCVGDKISLSAPLMEDATYAWSGPNSFTSTDRQPEIASAVVANAGTYSVIVTSKDNCESDAGEATIVVNSIPDAPTITTPIQYCQNESVSDEVSATGTDLKWYTTETGTTEFTSLVPSTAAIGSVHYFVSQTVNGCESERADLEIETLEPPSKPTISTNSPVCAGAKIELSTDAVGTYTWSGPNSFTSTEQNPEITNATAASAGDYTLTVKVGNCSSEPETTTIVVNSIPSTPVPTNDGPQCDGEDITLSVASVTNATYEWSGPNSFSSTDREPTIKASASTIGEYSVIVTIADCPSEAGKTTVTYYEIPDAPTIATPLQYCQDETVTDEVSAIGSNLSWYTTSDGTTKFTSLVPVTSTVGSVHYFVSQTVNGCESERADLEVKTLEPPSKPTITTNSPICVGDKLTLSTTAEGTYTWIGPNSFTATTQETEIASAVAASAGEYSLVVKVGNCTSEAGTATVVVNPIPTVEIDDVETLCIDASSVELKATVSPTGGTGSFSGTGVSSSTFFPATAGAGIHTVTYSYSVNGCSQTATKDITVQAKPEVSFTLPTTACKSGSTIALIGNQTGGSFTATPSLDLTSGFNPANATVGQEYVVTYEYDDGVCTNSTDNTITVYDPAKPVGTNVSKVYTKVTSGNVPALTATGVNQIWYSDEALTTQVGTGASYTPAESVVLDGATGKVGTYTYYVVSTDGGCTSEKTAVILEISSCAAEAPTPVANLVEVCSGETDNAKKTLSVTAGTGNIRWYYNNTLVQEDATTSYVPTQTDAGSYTFNASLYDTEANCESGKSSITYKINDLPVVSFNPTAEVCAGSSEIDLSTFKSQADGKIFDASDTEITSFNPSTAGTYSFTYSYTDANECNNTTNASIVVNPLPEITITTIPDKCEYDSEFDLSAFATPSGGKFVGEGVSQSTKFNPTAVTAGSSPDIVYTYIDANSCSNSQSFSINVIARPEVTFTTPNAMCVGGDAVDFKQYVTPNTGSFVGDHISGTEFNPEEVGSFDITYTVTASGCSTDIVKSAKVNKLPEITVTANAVECVNTGDITPTLSPVGGTLTIDDVTATAINTNTLSVGNHTLNYTYVDANNCSNSKSQSVEIRKIEKPIVSNKSIVTTSTDLSITATGNGGTLVWTDPNGKKTTANSISHPNSDVAGEWEYCVTETDGTCTSEPACLTFTVINCPTPAPSVTVADTIHILDNVADVLMTEVCASDDIPTFFVSGLTGATITWYNGSNVVTTSTPEAFMDATIKGIPGTYYWNVTQTTTGENGCEGVATQVGVVVNPNPIISISNTKADFCDYDGDVTLETTTDITGGTFLFSGEAVSNNTFAPADATTIGSSITITASYEAPTGCKATATKDFTVHHVNPLSVTSPVTQLATDYETVLKVTPEGTNKVTWYDACDTKDKITTGSTYSTGLVGERSEDYGVTQTDKFGCESECATIQVNRIKCPTPAPTVAIADFEICATDEVPTFEASGEGSIFSWYENGALVSNNADFAPTDIQGKAGSYSWTVTQTTTGVNGCEGVATPVTLKINPSPEIEVTIDDVICFNEGLKTPTSNLAGTTFKFDNQIITSIDPTDFGAGIYELSYSYNDPITGCPAVSAATNCYDNSCLVKNVEIREIEPVKVENITQLVTADEFKVSIKSGNGGAYTWIDEFNNLLAIGATIDHQYENEVGSWTYCVTETDGVCSSDPSCLTYSIINCPVPAPTINETDIIACLNEEMPSFEANESEDYTIRWYSGNDMSTIIAIGSSFTPNNVTNAGEYKYYATQYDDVCEGLPTPVTLDIKSTPQPKITGNKVVCENEELTLSADVEALWYSDETMRIADEIATTHTVSYETAGSYIVYVTRQSDYCTSNPVSVTIQVNAIPTPPIVNVDNVCKGNDVVFNAEGTDIQWYRNIISVGEGSTYTESNLLPGNITIGATQTINGCTSPIQEATATIYDIPSKPTAVSQTICDYNNIVDLEVLTQGDAIATWYSDEDLNIQIATGNSYTPYKKENQSYFVTQTENGCESEASKVSLTVNPKPADLTFKQTNDIEVCEGNEAVIVAESSLTVHWYENTTGRPIFTGRYFTVPETEVGEYVYYASQTDDAGCVSDKVSKKVKIVGGPTYAIVVKQDTICEYDNPGRLIVTRQSENETVSWISPSGATICLGDTLDVPKGLIKKAGVYNFKARTTVATCSFETRKETTLKYVVNAKPANPTLTKSAFCFDGQPVTLTTKAQNVVWFNENKNVVATMTQEYATPHSAVGNYNVYMTQTLKDCTSDTAKISFLISDIPSPIITGETGVCAGETESYVVTKSAEGNSIQWGVTGNRISYELSSYSSGFVRSIDWTAIGFDTISVVETNKYGCIGTTELPVEVIGVPDAQFIGETLGQEGVVTFTNLSEAQIVSDKGTEKEYHVDYFWDFGRKTDTALVLQNDNVFEELYRYGNYTAELTAINEYGCENSIQGGFFVDVEHGLFIPTAFCPTNPAAEVRLFKPKGFNCRTFKIWIYDNWNNLVYYSEGVNDSGCPIAEWDGKVNNKMMQAGMYRYKVEVTYEDSEEDNLRKIQTVKPFWGSVMLMR